MNLSACNLALKLERLENVAFFSFFFLGGGVGEEGVGGIVFLVIFVLQMFTFSICIPLFFVPDQ